MNHPTVAVPQEPTGASLRPFRQFSPCVKFGDAERVYAMNYYQFHIGDYRVATSHLSLLENLAYRLLLDLYYSREAALPADVGQVARLIGMRNEADIVDVVLNEFFTLGSDGWANFRCEAEIVKAQAAKAAASAKGKASGLARAKAAAIRNANRC